MPLALLGGSPVRARPFTAWPAGGREEELALGDVLRNGVWGGYHPVVKEFERAFADQHQVPYAISCVNGTVALEVALRAVGVGPGDEVIVPPFTFVASASAVLLCQAAPVFADIDPLTLNLSPLAAEAAITPRTRAIVIVHFGGQPAEMDAFRAIARRHDVCERGPVYPAESGYHQRDGGRRHEVTRGEDRDRFRSAQRFHENRAREGGCSEVERQVPDERDGRELPDARW